jgi:hypothetical protein
MLPQHQRQALGRLRRIELTMRYARVAPKSAMQGAMQKIKSKKEPISIGET